MQTIGDGQAYTYSASEIQTTPAPEPKPELVTYSKAIQTDDLQSPPRSEPGSDAEDAEGDAGVSRSSKRLSRRDRERDEEIRQKIRKEIEEELQMANRGTGSDSMTHSTQVRYPMRMLDDDELKAVTSSNDFLDFVERSSKVIERALDEEYDVLADYELGINGDMEEDEETGKKRRGIREVCQFYDERWSKKRMITDLTFSPKVRDLQSPKQEVFLCCFFFFFFFPFFPVTDSATVP